MFLFSDFSYISLIPLFILFILIGGVLASILIRPHEFQKTRTFVFISIMGSIAVIILSFNVFLSSITVETQKYVNNIRFTKEAVDKLWLFPNQLFTEKKGARPEFLASLYYNNLTLYELTKNLKTEPTVDSALSEQYISIVLIQCWEDFLTVRTLDKTGTEVWLVNFLQWAQSPYLKEAFDNLKYNFSATTIKFGELLFEYSSQISIPATDPKIYEKLAMKMLNDSRLEEIFTEREKKTKVIAL